MNATSSNSGGGFLDSGSIGGFGYGIGVSVGILFLITTITLASYFCTRAHPPPSPTTNARRNNNHQQLPPDDHIPPSFVISVEMGLDDATILSYPKLMYSETKQHHRGNSKDSTDADACCSICLADYKASDMLRLLPDCGHMFHLPCVDPWLRLNPTCPVCRTSPLPTPLSTPLAEVVPLASRQGG